MDTISAAGCMSPSGRVNVDVDDALMSGAGAPELVVVGSVSVDCVTAPGRPPVVQLGGAGLYAALAAATHIGVGIAGLLTDDPLATDRPWRRRIDDAGLMRRPGTALRFDITYDERWRATYRVDDAKAEELLDHGQLPPSFRRARGFHLCPFGDPVAQLRYALAVRADPATRHCQLTAGTFGPRIAADRDVVLRLWSLCDGFVCSLDEAALLIGSTPARAVAAVLDRHKDRPAGRVTLITDGESGCYLIVAGKVWPIPAFPAAVVDPTGAGETLGGAFAAARLAGADWLPASRYAAAVASIAVECPGPLGLLGVDRSVAAARMAAQSVGVGG